MRQFLLLLPGMACLFWLVLYRIMSTRERVYRYAMFVLAIQSVYYFAAVMPLVVTDVARTVVICTLLEHAFGLVSIPALLSYLYVMRGCTEKNSLLRLSYYLPVILVFAECVIIWIIGYGNATQFVMDINSGRLTGFSLDDRSQELLYFCLVIGFKVIIGMQYLFFIILSLVHITDSRFRLCETAGFYFKTKKTDTAYAQCTLMLVATTFNVCMLVLGKSYAVNMRWPLYVMPLFVTLFVTVASLTGTAGDNVRCSFHDICSLLKFNRPTADSTVRSDENTSGAAMNLRVQQAAALTSVAVPQTNLAQTLELTSRFENLMLQERMFLERNITLADVAERLGVGKEQLSDMLDDVYGIPFSSYLNMLRIDYAEQFILNNENVTQKYIAQACGFSSAASFNVAFTKYAGVTPKIWKDRCQELSQRTE